MSGVYPPHQGAGMPGPERRPEQPVFPPNFGGAWGPYRPPEPPPSAQFPTGPVGPPPFPGPVPPPVPYPDKSRWKPIVAAVTAVVVIGAVVAAVTLLGRGDDARGAVLTTASAQEAIQGYLDALSDSDVEAISRNSLCGLYDGVKDRRADDALARLSSDAFQKQFSSARVTSVDTMVFASPSSAQALFSMQVVPAVGNRGGDDTRQGVAQLLAYGDDVLVCSYVLRTAGTF
ncbi:hypothetical protein MMUR_30360 [Mycolicibacterium murale]|jgi:hypothetical protein|uniref:DUF8174 domain-containing protein n=1 Tax=Mycolicibacterium murale TaxID=182220 RepID=A0A7I9WNH9_9MYCO|nr:hypothetical protein [Mycolicibacterium murale]MCV7184469.1 hypothetical protein [Mycolicibacterium murale]GFG58900.1 hypothetical protein MMUR_30360 [Mycolicibacterium murale]